jgi:hypothetical protein
MPRVVRDGYVFFFVFDFETKNTDCIKKNSIATFSENWGYLCVSPVASGNLFSFLFGWNVDVHNKPRSFINLIPVMPSSAPNCSQGLYCYVDAIYLTMGTGVFTVLLGIWAGYKDRQRKILAHWHAMRKLARDGVSEDDVEG